MKLIERIKEYFRNTSFIEMNIHAMGLALAVLFWVVVYITVKQLIGGV